MKRLISATGCRCGLDGGYGGFRDARDLRGGPGRGAFLSDSVQLVMKCVLTQGRLISVPSTATRGDADRALPTRHETGRNGDPIGVVGLEGLQRGAGIGSSGGDAVGFEIADGVAIAPKRTIADDHLGAGAAERASQMAHHGRMRGIGVCVAGVGVDLQQHGAARLDRRQATCQRDGADNRRQVVVVRRHADHAAGGWRRRR